MAPPPQPWWKLHPCMPVEVLAAWSRWFHFSSYERQGDSFVSHSIMSSVLMTGGQYVQTSRAVAAGSCHVEGKVGGLGKGKDEEEAEEEDDDLKWYLCCVWLVISCVHKEEAWLRLMELNT